MVVNYRVTGYSIPFVASSVEPHLILEEGQEKPISAISN